MESDKDIWKKSLDDPENADLFDTKPGGPVLEEGKKIFKTDQERSMDRRIRDLEKDVQKLKDLFRNLSNENIKLTKKIRLISNESNNDPNSQPIQENNIQ